MVMLLPPHTAYGKTWPSVRHYYGDIVRALFVINAVIITAIVPFSGDILIAARLGAPAVIILIILAGFTNPHGKSVLVLGALISAIGVLFAEVLSITAYNAENWIFFFTFEIVSILFLVALYYGVKNVRAMALDKIGRIDGVGEFDKSEFVVSVNE